MSDQKKVIAVKAGSASFGPPPDLRARGVGGIGVVIMKVLNELEAPKLVKNPETGEEELAYQSVFIAGVEKTSQVSSKISEARKRGELIDEDAGTMRVFSCKALFEKDEESGEDVKGLRIWRLADEPISTEDPAAT